MKRLVVAIPHSHTWFWTQTCLACLQRHPPSADGYEVRVVVVDNSPWSPAIRGVTDTPLGEDVFVFENYKSNKFHASALDCVVDEYTPDLLMALETDVMVLRDGWLQWFVDQLRKTDYAVGHWHHEEFVNPSCTLYRGDVLEKMQDWCHDLPEPETLRWGQSFQNAQQIAERRPERDYRSWFGENVEWVRGPFAEKRGWPEGTVLLKEQPSGQLKGPGWYEPGQQLHHWALQEGYTYTVCPSITTKRADGVPLQTVYGGWGKSELNRSYPESARCGVGNLYHDHGRQLEAVELFGNGVAAHLWGGTRALDIIKHDVTCEFVRSNTPTWLAREARFWRSVVPEDVQEQSLALIRKWGWHYRGQGTPDVTDRDRQAVEYVRGCYAQGGVTW